MTKEAYFKKSELLKKIIEYSALSNFDVDKVKKAYELADKMHKGQTRKSGEEYVTHPLTVALYLTEFGADQDTVIAAILHDTIEDTPLTSKEIKDLFGKDVLQIVEGVTKLESDNFIHEQQYDVRIESLRKLFSHMKTDIRILIVKLFDRLHNLRTLDARKPEDAKRVARETVDVYVPLIEHLGIGDLKKEFKNICFQYIYKDEYEKTKNIFNKDESRHIRAFNKLQQECYKTKCPCNRGKIIMLQENLLDYYEKHIRDLGSNGNSTETNAPLIVKIIVKNVLECYEALSYLHKVGKVQENHFKDYISSPHENTYQSIHTEILDSDGNYIECRIRTPEMDDQARRGILVKCFNKGDHNLFSVFKWIKSIEHIDAATKEQSDLFWESIKNDILKNRISILDKSGQVTHVSQNSTVLDYAFSLSNSKRNALLRAGLVNNQTVPLNYILKDGDKVELLYSGTQKVALQWLSWVSNEISKSRIKLLLSQEPDDIKVKKGQLALQRELSRYKLGYVSEVSEPLAEKIRKKYKLESSNEIFIKIAEGEIKPSEVRITGYGESLQKDSNIDLKIVRQNRIAVMAKISKCITDKGFEFKHLSTTTLNGKAIDRIIINHENPLNTQSLIEVLEIIPGCFSVEQVFPYKRLKSTIYLIVVMLLWAINPIIIHYLGINNVTPIASLGLRLWAGGTFLALLKAYEFYFKRRYAKPYKLNKTFWISTILVVASLYSIHASATYSTPLNMSLFLSVATMITAMLKIKSTKGRKSLKTKLAIASVLLISVISLVLIFLISGDLPFMLEGNLMGLAALVTWVLYTKVTTLYCKQQNIKHRTLHFLGSMFITAALVISPILPWEEIFSMRSDLLALGLLNGVLNAGIAHLFFFKGTLFVKHYVNTLIIGLIMVPTMIADFLIFGFSPLSLIPMALLASSVLTVSWLEKKHTPL